MAKRKGKGKIHPLLLLITKTQQFKTRHVVNREDEISLSPPAPSPQSETPPPGSDHVNKLSFQRENTCLDLVVSHCSPPVSIAALPPLTTPPFCLETMPYETPVKTSKLSSGKKKRKRIWYNSCMKKKIETLGEHLNPIPFSPKKFLDLASHKCLLTHLGLWDFLNVHFDKVIFPGLIEQLVANYNPKRRPDRASFVDGYTINVSRSVMASALRFPTKRKARKRKYPDQDDALESEVLVVSEEDALFVEELVWSYMVLQDADCEMPDEVMKIVSDVRDRKLEKVDWSGLIWFMMKRELLKETTLRNCYYASHMQLLVEYQKPWLFDSVFPDARFLEMGSAVGGEGYVEDNQLQLLDGNEIGNREIDLVNGMFLENSYVDSVETEAGMQIEAVKTMDSAQLRCCTLKKCPSLELSLATGEGYVEDNQLQLLDDNEIGNREIDLVNGMFLENSSVDSVETEAGMQIEAVKTMDSAQLRCCTLKKCPSLELSLATAEVSQEEKLVEGQSGDRLETLAGETEVIIEVTKEDQKMIEDQICALHAKQALEVEQKCKDLMTRLFDEAENDEAKELFNEEVCDAKVGAVLDTRQEEDASMDTQIDNSIRCPVDGNDDLHNLETSWQQIGLVVKQAKGSTEVLSEVLVEENLTSEQVCISYNDEVIELEHKDTLSTEEVDLIVRHDTSQTRLGFEVEGEKQTEESKQLVEKEICGTKIGALLDIEDASMDTQIDNSSQCPVDGNDDLRNLETSWQQIGLVVKQAKGSTEVLSEVLVEENNNILTSEQVCVSHKDEMIELEHKDRLSTEAKGSTEVLSEVLVEENNNILTSEQVCVSHKDEMIELEHKDRLSTEVDVDHIVTQHICVSIEDAKEIGHDSMEMILGHDEEHSKESSQLVKDVCDTKISALLDTKAGATMDETYANSENQEADFLLAEEGIQEVVEKPVSPQGGQENVQENACFCAETCGQFLGSAPLDSAGGSCFSEVQVVDAIVLESDEEEEESEHQLNCIDGSEGFVLQQPSLQCVEEVEAQSRKGHLERGDCHDLSKDLPVHGVQSISSHVEDHILPHHTTYHSSVNSFSPGLGMDMGTVSQLYQANAYKNESLVQTSRPESEINPSLPGPSFNGSLNREVRIWLSNLKSAANRQCRPYSVANEDLRRKLAQQIHMNQQYKILRHQEQEKQKREISLYARQLYLMDSLLNDYKKTIKETDKSFAKHTIHCQQPVESQYMDHPECKGKVITVAEWEKLVQERQNQTNRNIIQSMMDCFQHGLIVELEEHLCKLDKFCTRLSGCADSLNMLKAKTSRS